MPGARSAVWDPAQYERFKSERSRPFSDLLARVPQLDVKHAADLGCGTGELTHLLLERWPLARVFGVDSSREMLERARRGAAHPRLSFVQADLRDWCPPEPLDLIFTNATLQWLPDHGGLLAALSTRLAPGGALAVQVPNNRSEPAYQILAELVADPRFAPRLPTVGLVPTIESADWYLARLHELGMTTELWETIYYHQMSGPDGIVEWMKGTALRPVLTALPEAEAEEFLARLGARIEQAYPRGPAGVTFPFRRLFFVALRAVS